MSKATKSEATRPEFTVERSAPKNYRVPENAPTPPKFRTILCDAPWEKGGGSRSGYGGAIKHYNLMSLERIKELPVPELAADDAHIYMWCLDGNVDEAIECIRHWGFRFIGLYHWIKPKSSLGRYFRVSAETCVFGVKGKLPAQSHRELNFTIAYPGEHSEKPRGFISAVERVSPGPYCELFCRKRPASNRSDWWCWGNGVLASDYKKAGADFVVPGFPVPKYSFEDEPKPIAGAKDGAKDGTGPVNAEGSEK